MHRKLAPILQVLIATAILSGIPCRVAYGQGFTLYARSLIESDRRSSIRVTTNMPHPNLVFLKRNGGYVAEYRVYYQILRADEETVVETAVHTETARADSYDDTRSHKRTSNVARRFFVEPGEYVVRCTIRIQNTHLSYAKAAVVRVPDFVEAGIALGKPRVFVASRDSTRQALMSLAKSRAFVEQRESPSFAEPAKEPAFGFDVYLEKETTDTLLCDLFYQVLDERKHQVVYAKRRVHLSGTGETFVAFLHVDDWAPGSYELQVKALIAEPARAATTLLRFNVLFTEAAVTTHFEETLEILAVIGNDDEVRALRDAPARERLRVWEAFWTRRDPSPGTPDNEALDEHFRRLQHVEQNFSISGPGWRSDRGRVYLRHGQPDDVELRSDPALQGQFLIWRYVSEGLTFIFYDRFGLGEYRLSETRTL